MDQLRLECFKKRNHGVDELISTVQVVGAACGKAYLATIFQSNKQRSVVLFIKHPQSYRAGGKEKIRKLTQWN
jgi:hypothetical protein